jgi:hypothetical protein
VAVIDTIRPVSTRKVGDASAVPSGTLSAVTSDNSDATYILMALFGDVQLWNLRMDSHTPAAGYQRHRMRPHIRARCNGTVTGKLNDNIYAGRGTSDYFRFETVLISSVNPGFNYGTNWYQDAAFGLATPGALSDLNLGGGLLANASGGATENHTQECYIDIECRFHPDYTPEIQDAAGVDQSGGTVTDTDQPRLVFGGVGYDGLPPLDWSVNVKDALGASVYSADGAGTPPGLINMDVGLDDGAYTADFSARSIIRSADPFEWAVTLSFTVANTVPSSSPPNVTVEPEGDGYRVTWTDPGGQPWDNDFVVAEVYRDDCTGSQRIATVPDGLNGSYLDLAIPQLDPQTGQVDGVCTVHTDSCDITYRVRYWGYVSSFIELPDTIPADMILAWPDSVATIPSGWTRVTALDGFHIRAASGTGVPTDTGGSSTHTHTLPGHHHTIPAHSHSVGGNTGVSNTSTTSARFNGATQPQADQPHSHARPFNTGSHDATNTGDTVATAGAVNDQPPTREVIWIQSGGTQPGYPVNALAWATEDVSGWEADLDSNGRYLKGAAAAGDGGAMIGTASHAHAIGTHSHTGFNHDHSLANTGLSNPSSSQEAGTGSGDPRWLPRHTHPMDVASAGTGSTGTQTGGNTNSVSVEPPNRRLKVIRNAAGGTQTRVIGLYLGDVASLDPLLTLCNGSGGTPDMRNLFARDAGTDSVNSTGGSSTHAHTTPTHTHTLTTHSHNTSTGTSSTGSFQRPSSGDLGDSPTTGHTHASGDTSSVSPGVLAGGNGSAASADHTPLFHEAHFVRLDGTISGGPLPVPELKVTDFSESTVPAFTFDDGLDRIANLTDLMAITTSRNNAFPRLVADSTPLDGGLHTVATTIPGEDTALSIAVEGRAAIDELEELLRADRVYLSPLGGTPGWFAPQGWRVSAPVENVKVLAITITRQPWPTTPDPQEFL